MKGRGTRRYDFTENFTDQLVKDQIGPRLKGQFRIIDYFGVCEYFGEGDLYGDERRPTPHGSDARHPARRAPRP